MRRTTEAALLAGSALMACFGTVLVNFAISGRIGWTPVVFAVVYGCCLAGLAAAVRRWAPDASPFLLPPVSLLVALGLVEIYRIDPAQGSVQLWWVAAGVLVAICVLLMFRWGVERLTAAGYPLAVGGLSLIVLPFLSRLFGGSPDGETGLWLAVDRGEGRLLIQPFGLGLALLAVGLAVIHTRWALASPTSVGAGGWLAKEKHLLAMAAVWLVTLPLLWTTGDLTAWMTVVLLSGCIAYLATGESRVVWTALGLVGAGALLGLTSSRVRETIGVWMDPFITAKGDGGLRESLLAWGSGYLSGSGLGMGDPGLIPRATSDWILASLGEELGLAGTVAVIALYALVVAVGIGVALGSRDLFHKVTAASLSALLGLVFLAGVGGLERLLPPTGMGLPFLAYGGFPMLTGWLVMGLLLRISDQERGRL